MPSSVVYTNVNGQVLSENRGGVVSHFIPDPLGSVVMVRDNAGNTVYTAEYDPYGTVQTSTGTNPSEFGFVGTLGYLRDSAFMLYVRARYLLNALGRWLTRDPLWPGEAGFLYAEGSPVQTVDPYGNSPGGNLVTCINAWVALGYSARSACLRCKAVQGYQGGYRCECHSNGGTPVPPWSGPPAIVPPLVIGWLSLPLAATSSRAREPV